MHLSVQKATWTSCRGRVTRSTKSYQFEECSEHKPAYTGENHLGPGVMWLLHHQGIPHKSLFIGGDDYKNPTRALTDVLSYRTWNPETLELK